MYTNKELKEFYKDTFGKSAGNKNKKTLETELYKEGVLTLEELSDTTKSSLELESQPVVLPEEPVFIEVKSDTEGIKAELEAIEKLGDPPPVKTFKGQAMIACKIICPRLNKYIGGFVYCGVKGELIDVAECHLPLLVKWKNVEKV